MRIYRRDGVWYLTDGSGADRIRGAVHRLYAKYFAVKILPNLSHKQAEAKAHEIYRVLRLPAQTGTYPYALAVKQFLDHCQANKLKPSTIAGHSRHLRQFGDSRQVQVLGDITPRRIIGYLDAMASSGRTKNHHLTSVSRLCGYAVKMAWLKANPAREVERQREIDQRVGQFIPANDLDRICAATDPVFADVIRIGYHTGRRQGEIYWLWSRDWQPVDLELGLMIFPVGVTKMSEPERVPISSTARQAVERLREFQERPLGSPGAISQKWRRLMRRLGMSYRFHDLRVTFSTRLREAGYGDTEVMYFLGQKTPGLASTTYTRHQIQHLRDAVESLAG